MFAGGFISQRLSRILRLVHFPPLTLTQVGAVEPNGCLLPYSDVHRQAPRVGRRCEAAIKAKLCFTSITASSRYALLLIVSELRRYQPLTPITTRVASANTLFLGLASFSRCVMYSASTMGGLPGGHNTATSLLAP
jgi:hypothetical protein